MTDKLSIPFNNREALLFIYTGKQYGTYNPIRNAKKEYRNEKKNIRIQIFKILDGYIRTSRTNKKKHRHLIKVNRHWNLTRIPTNLWREKNTKKLPSTLPTFPHLGTLQHHFVQNGCHVRVQHAGEPLDMSSCISEQKWKNRKVNIIDKLTLTLCFWFLLRIQNNVNAAV